ncbi:MAG TPA: hypothetical protein VHX68_20690 [Planctomycetaceae bacterium]|nr:hypothetical protein [Planctomycetaceae bacterium]
MPHMVRAQLALKALLMALAFLPAALMAADAAAGKSGSTDEIPTVELTVAPAAAPVPALKYRFLTTPAERTRGNAALDYYRAVVQNSLIPSDKAPSWVKDYGLAAVPLDKFPKEEVARQMEPYRQVLIAMERAARRDHCEWQVPLEDGFETQLPEFQNIRDPVRLVNTRARLQMARGELEAALDSFRINYELSQKITECRTIINSLIGVAIVSVTREQLETFVQQPHAPNLYWALSELPVPLINFRGAILMEPYSVENSFPELAEFRSRRLTRDEARHLSSKIVAKWIKSGLTVNLPKTLEEAERRFAASAEANYPEAKQLLIDAGRPKDEVEAMPVEQAVWLASFHRWHSFWDEMIKWTFLPGPQRLVGLQQVVRRLADFHDAHRDAIFELTELIAAVPQALAASDRADRQLALLRIEEAIRLYASAHSGQLPDSLDKIDAVPIPKDPMTGTSFVYRLDGDHAVVETPPTPKTVPENKFQGRRYIIHIRK